ncbi:MULTISPECIES: hypothetical protein [Bacillales]|uniref:hypothetical protein n=1 Tax=Bacillales TaxID=1385 RepID=UPI000348C03E|nr:MULTISPECIES: hypothetical protein [Bacillales]
MKLTTLARGQGNIVVARLTLHGICKLVDMSSASVEVHIVINFSRGKLCSFVISIAAGFMTLLLPSIE